MISMELCVVGFHNEQENEKVSYPHALPVQPVPTYVTLYHEMALLVHLDKKLDVKLTVNEQFEQVISLQRSYGWNLCLGFQSAKSKVQQGSNVRFCEKPFRRYKGCPLCLIF